MTLNPSHVLRLLWAVPVPQTFLVFRECGCRGELAQASADGSSAQLGFVLCLSVS